MGVVCRIRPLYYYLSESGIGSTAQVEQGTNYRRRPAVPIVSFTLVSDELCCRWGDVSIQVEVFREYPLWYVTQVRFFGVFLSVRVQLW